MPVDVVINFRALPGRATELRALLSQGRDISRADGCESFELYQREDDEHKFMFLERWTSIDAHHGNMANNIVACGHLAPALSRGFLRSGVAEVHDVVAHRGTPSAAALARPEEHHLM